MQIEILRRASAADAPYWQSFDYDPAEEAETVATALTRLNGRPTLTDTAGNAAAPIRWDCGCLQKKCGACAVVINRKPGLACGARLSELKKPIRLEPLRKFPVIADLMVDRSIMFENLKGIAAWLQSEAAPSEKKNAVAYEASRCLQCGCCLEVCPNFMPGGRFFGMAAAVPATRLLAELPASEQKELAVNYRKHVYNGCGKSLSCRDICPAGIDIEALMVRSNASAVWNRLFDR